MPLPPIKKFLPLIIAAATGLMAVVLINIYVQQQSAEAKKQAYLSQKNISTVVIAKQDIPSGTAIKESMLAEERKPKNIIQPRAATSIDRVVDKITLAPISKGEQILLNKISISGQEGSLSMKVPQGKRAITIPVDNISSVGGMIRPGDHVDVVGMVPMPAMNAEGKQVTQMTTMPLFQDVLVLAVGQEFATTPAGASGTRQERTSSSVITFALLPQEANLIAFVQEQGRIRLVLRSPGDTQVQQAAPATWDTVLRTVMPQMFQTEGQDLPKPKPKRQVEIYRGLEKEVRSLDE